MIAESVQVTNPFTFEYLDQELSFYNLPENYNYKKDELHIVNTCFEGGQLADYFNDNFYTQVFNIPVLRINSKTWMSVTAMEIQSAYLQLKRSNGIVATCGLGLGYFALRAGSKSEVTQVDVYEINENLIDWFNQTFSNRREFQKINIIKGDVFDNLKNKTYDYVFMDRYRTMLPDEVATNIYHFGKTNQIKRYDFWGQERVLFSAWNAYKLSTPIDYYSDVDFFRMWMSTKVEGTQYRLSSLYVGDIGKEYCKLVCKALRWLRNRECK